LLALLAAERVLADAEAGRRASAGGGHARPLDNERVSVILGSAALELQGELAGRLGRPLWFRALREQGLSEDRARAICDRIAQQWVPWQEASRAPASGSTS
jgi:hypothetical protein